MVPPLFHKYLTIKSKNNSNGNIINYYITHTYFCQFNENNLIIFIFLLAHNGTHNILNDQHSIPKMYEIQRMIAKYNEIQMVYNEDAFGPLQNDSVIVVIQVFIFYNL